MTEQDLTKRPANRVASTAKKNRLWRYGPLVLWAVVIFIGSGDVLAASHTSILVRIAHYLFPGVSPENLALFHFLVRKGGHLTEYAILAGLAARAFRTSSQETLRRHWFGAAWIVVIVYALSDEFHQSFVPSRGASIYDSMIDSVGGLMGLVIVLWRGRRTRRKERRRAPAIKANAAT